MGMPLHKTLLRLGAAAFLCWIAVEHSPEALLGMTTAHAAVQPSKTFIEEAAKFCGFVITLLNFLAWFVFSLLDHVMDPKFIFALNPDGTDGALLHMLRGIWQFFRDMVNIGFAFALIAGALHMIITADGSKVKEHLPKFLLAIVLVNFSWFVPRVIFDVSQVLTYTIYQLPSLMGADACTVPPNKDGDARKPCDVVIEYRFLEQTRKIVRIPFSGGSGIDSVTGSTGWSCPLADLVCIRTAPINSLEAQALNTHTKVLDGLVINHARMQGLTKVDLGVANGGIPEGLKPTEVLKRLTTITMKLFLVLVLHVALVFPLIAMLVAFIIRIPVLWITIAFMPLVALGYVFDKTKEVVDQIQKNFLQAAFLPVKIAVPMTVGFILINAGSAIEAPPDFRTIGPISIVTGIRDMWQMLWMLISLFILWKFTFEQLKSDKAGLMGMFTDKIQGIGQSLGNMALQLPMATPLFPLGGKNINELLHTVDPRNIERDMRIGGLRGAARGIDNRFNANNFAPDGSKRMREAITKLDGGAIAAINNNLTQFHTPDIDDKTRTERFKALVETLRTSLGVAGTGRPTNELIQALIASGRIAMTVEQRQRLEKFAGGFL